MFILANLVFALLLTGPATGQLIFEDGFESGDFSQWSTTSMTPVFLRPVEDVERLFWETDTGGTVDLFQRIDDVVPDDDASFIQNQSVFQSPPTAPQRYLAKMGGLDGIPRFSDPPIFRYRWELNGIVTAGQPILTVSLQQGDEGLTILSRTHIIDSGTTWALEELVFTEEEFGKVTDWADVHLLFYYIPAVMEIEPDTGIRVTYAEIEYFRRSPLDEITTEMAILVDVDFVDSDDNVELFRFSDRPFYDETGVDLIRPPPASGAIVYRDLISDIGTMTFTRVSGTKLRGSSSPTGSVIKVLSTEELYAALDGKNCERQRLTIRKGRPNTPIGDFEVTFDGIAEGHETSESMVTIRPFSPAKFFEVDFQGRTWEGRGRNVHVDDSVAGGGWIQAEPPVDPTEWDVAGAVTIEIGVTFDAVAAGDEEIVNRDDVFRLRRTAAGEPEVDWILDAGGTTVFTGTAVMTGAGFYHVAVRWDGVDLAIFVNGVVDLSPTSAGAPEGTSVLPFVLGGAGTDQLAGTLDILRYWLVDRTDQQIADNATADPLAPLDVVDLELLLPINEGLLGKTFDPDRPHEGQLRGTAEWRGSGTGDAQLRGKKQCSAFGFVPNADVVLLDAIEQTYGFHFRGAEGVIPKVGGRKLASAWSVTGTVSFFPEDRIIRGEPFGIDLSEAVPYQVIEITGPLERLNRRTFNVAEEPREIDDAWEIKVREALAPELSVAGVTVESITSFTQEVEATVTGDFDDVERTFTADNLVTASNSGDLDGFTASRKVQVAGGGSLNDGRVFTLAQDPWQDASDSWNLKFDQSPVVETSVAVTFLQATNLGEYTVDLGSATRSATFTLLFQPTKRVTAEVSGDNVGGYVDTGLEIVARMLSVMGSEDTRALTVVQQNIDELQATYDWEAGFFDPGGGTTKYSQALDFMVHGIGLHWLISPRTGKFDVVDLPPTTSSVIDRDLSVQDKAFSIKMVRSRKARRHVEVLFAKNHAKTQWDDLDFSVATDLSVAGMEIVQTLIKDWQPAIFPENGDENLEPDSLESPLVLRADALELAERLFENVMGYSNSFYEIPMLLEYQRDDPWSLRVALSNEEDPHLVEPREAYAVTVGEDPFRSKMVVMVIEDA